MHEVVDGGDVGLSSMTEEKEEGWVILERILDGTAFNQQYNEV